MAIWGHFYRGCSHYSRLALSGPNTKTKILILGLHGAGKTTIVYKLKIKETLNTIPIFGYYAETLEPENVILHMWDVGGQDKIRHFWRHYFQGSQGLLFVIDSSDIQCFNEAKEELFSILDAEEFNVGVPVVVIANKQDLSNAQSASEMTDQLGLIQHKKNPWYVQEAVAKNGEGVYEALDHLVQMVKFNTQH